MPKHHLLWAVLAISAYTSGLVTAVADVRDNPRNRLYHRDHAATMADAQTGDVEILEKHRDHRGSPGPRALWPSALTDQSGKEISFRASANSETRESRPGGSVSPVRLALSLTRNDTETRALAYYVSPAGDDANPGTESAPFATIQRASEASSAGVTIYVKPGIYRGHIHSTKSGTPSARIRFVSTMPHAAVIQIGTAAAEAIWKNAGSYIDIEGFDIQGSHGATIGIHNHGSYVRIIGNKVHDIPDLSCSNNGGAGILLDGYETTNNDIVRNEVYRIGLGNCTETYFHAIYLSDDGGRVQTNLVYGNRGRGIQTNHGARNKVIANNLIFDNYDGIAIANWDTDVPIKAAGFFVANNIILYSRNWAIIEDDHTGANRYVNNLLYKNNNEQYHGGIYLNATQGSRQTGTMHADPAFVDFRIDGGGDYRLRRDSPAVDAGTLENSVATDFRGASRLTGNGVDLGIYECH